MERVECIVVGGGLAGLSAAYGLADAGLEVMVLERGDYPGGKNVTGGRLYVQPLEGIYPELWGEAPFERPVARELISLVGDGDEATIEVASERFVERPHSYTVIRAKLDKWLGERVSEKGAMVLPKMKVDSLLCETSEDGPRRVVGIRAGSDEIAADVVVVAEGVLGLLASGAGLRRGPEPRHLAVGYKETLELPPHVIEDRWRLNPGEGAAHLFVGTVTCGIPGGGFIYTNRESISLGLVVGMAHLRAPGSTTRASELLTQFKELPHVRPLVAGGNLVEYSAHAISAGSRVCAGWRCRGPLSECAIHGSGNGLCDCERVSRRASRDRGQACTRFHGDWARLL
jgi:electron transfer flavoprotein-quinone oxidoreductase